MKKITLLFAFLVSGFVFSQPTTNAPTPTTDVANVVSIFSDEYTDIATNYNPNWGQPGICCVNTTFDPTSGGTNFVLAYGTFTYQGTELTTTNLSDMEFLHVDIWVAPGTDRLVKISPINNGSGAGEFLVVVPLTPGSWNSVDLPKSAFTGMTWDSVFQMKFDGQFNGDGSANTTPFDIYLDNIYFWKNTVDPNADATLSDLQVDAVTIDGFSAGTTMYTYEVPNGTTVVPTVTATATQAGNGSSNVAITPAAQIPGTTTIIVTAPDGTTTLNYTVEFVEGAPLPPTPAPTPPARPVNDVVSVYSGEYTNVNFSGFEVFGTASVMDVDISGDSALQFIFDTPGQGFQYLYSPGSTGSSTVDLTGFTKAHIDLYISGTEEPGEQLLLQLLQWNGSGHDPIFTTFPLSTTGTENWYSADLDLSSFSNPNGAPLTDIELIQVIAQGPDSFGPIYIDNIYFHKGTLGINDVSLNEIKIFPNPTNNTWNIKTNNQRIESVIVFDVLGKQVYASKPNSSEFVISSSKLSNGVYFAKITTANGESNIRLVKN
ncbi:MAG: T9SS type A sorting domain-containing protein [Flavobacteriaceae bacterium]